MKNNKKRKEEKEGRGEKAFKESYHPNWGGGGGGGAAGGGIFKSQSIVVLVCSEVV